MIGESNDWDFTKSSVQGIIERLIEEIDYNIDTYDDRLDEYSRAIVYSSKKVLKYIDKLMKDYSHNNSVREDNPTLNKAVIKNLINKIIDFFNKDCMEDRGSYTKSQIHGFAFTYYCLMDIIENELDYRLQDLNEYGINFDIEKKFLGSFD